MGKKWAADLVLIAVLLLLMGYSLIGEELHEWLGVGMFLLLIFHHAVNVPWYRNLKKGPYSLCRCAQTVLTVLLLFTALGTLLSSLVLSRYVLDFLPLHESSELAGSLHLPCACWIISGPLLKTVFSAVSKAGP